MKNKFIIKYEYIVYSIIINIIYYKFFQQFTFIFNEYTISQTGESDLTINAITGKTPNILYGRPVKYTFLLCWIIRFFQISMMSRFSFVLALMSQ